MPRVYRVVYGGVCEVWVEVENNVITKVLAATAGALHGQRVDDLPAPRYSEVTLLTEYGLDDLEQQQHEHDQHDQANEPEPAADVRATP